MQINNIKLLRKLAQRSLHYVVFQSWRIFTSTPRHKRLRLSLFLSGMWTLFFLIPLRALVLLAVYLWFRHVDDVADRELDNPLPGPGGLKKFIAAKRMVLQRLASNQIEMRDLQGIDSLMSYSHLKCLMWGFDIIPSMHLILDSVSYDVERSGIEGAPSKMNIGEYFKKLDLPTALETLRIIGETSVGVLDLQGFMDATRIYFNLRDMLRDAAVGIFNISAEDLREYQIDLELIKRMGSLEDLMRVKGFRDWFRSQLEEMQGHLEGGKRILKARRAMPVTRLMLRVGFALPCQKFAKKWAKY